MANKNKKTQPTKPTQSTQPTKPTQPVTEQEIHTAIKKLLILNKKAKIKIIAGIILAKRYIAKNKIKIKKYELGVKTEPKLAQFYKAKADDLKAKNILLTKIINILSVLETELNKEIGWLTNEAGALHTKNFALIKKAIKQESACLLKQKEVMISLFKLIKTLKVKKPVLKKKVKAKEAKSSKEAKAKS